MPALVIEPPARDLEHILTEVIGGTAGTLAVDIEHLRLQDADRLLLCTNGLLTDLLTVAEIEEVLRRRVTPDDQCKALVDRYLRPA